MIWQDEVERKQTFTIWQDEVESKQTFTIWQDVSEHIHQTDLTPQFPFRLQDLLATKQQVERIDRNTE